MEKKMQNSILELMHAEIKPALGCTEPAAVALACGKAREILGSVPVRGKIFVSGNIFKNALGVGIPGTGLTGLPIAAALGFTGGNSCDMLEILKTVDAQQLKAAKKLVDDKVFTIQVKEKVPTLYVEVQAENNKDVVTVIISHEHTHFSFIKRNGEILLDDFPKEKTPLKNQNISDIELTVDDILKFVETVDIESLSFFQKSVDLNTAIAKEGIERKYGFEVGKTIAAHYGNDFSKIPASEYAIMLTTSASDARMGGSKLAVMSNTGSGNQGLTSSLPIIAYAEKLGKSKEELYRSLALGHLIPIHMKKKLGPLGALCGVLLAATGAACGIARLQGANGLQIKNIIKFMASNITGMICDGAKPGCSLKVYSGVSAAIHAATMALNNIEVLNDGIVDPDVEKTIENIAIIGYKGLAQTDKIIIDLMQNKA